MELNLRGGFGNCLVDLLLLDRPLTSPLKFPPEPFLGEALERWAVWSLKGSDISNTRKNDSMAIQSAAVHFCFQVFAVSMELTWSASAAVLERGRRDATDEPPETDGSCF